MKDAGCCPDVERVLVHGTQRASIASGFFFGGFVAHLFEGQIRKQHQVLQLKHT